MDYEYIINAYNNSFLTQQFLYLNSVSVIRSGFKATRDNVRNGGFAYLQVLFVYILFYLFDNYILFCVSNTISFLTHSSILHVLKLFITDNLLKVYR